MFISNARITAIAIGMLCAIYPQISLSGGFKSSDFLKWSPENRSWYLEVAVTMAASIASQNVKGQSHCIYDWYFRGGKVAPNREKQILKAMRTNSSYHPHAVTLAVLQKACGSFSYAKGKR